MTSMDSISVDVMEGPVSCLSLSFMICVVFVVDIQEILCTFLIHFCIYLQPLSCHRKRSRLSVADFDGATPPKVLPCCSATRETREKNLKRDKRLSSLS